MSDPRQATITIQLLDARATGRVKCWMTNRTFRVYVIPRSLVEESTSITELSYPGVYILYGNGEDGEQVYIGQANVRSNTKGLLGRIAEHKRKPDKSFFTKAILITAGENQHGATELNFLEQQLYLRANQADRAQVMNANTPGAGAISEENRLSVMDYLEDVETTIGALGYRFLTPLASAAPSSEQTQTRETSQQVFMLKREDVDAIAEVTDEGFVLRQGSVIRVSEKNKTMPPAVRKLRAKHRSAISSEGEVMRDILFTSPSGAAQFVLGYSINGREAWVNAQGTTIKQMEESESEEFSDAAPNTTATTGAGVGDHDGDTEKSQPDEADAAIGAITFHFSRSGGDATAKIDGKQLRVLRGSRLAPELKDYVRTGTRRMREKLAASIIDGVLDTDVLFDSPSGAAAFVNGGTSNGLTDWKTSDGRPLKEFWSSGRS